VQVRIYKFADYTCQEIIEFERMNNEYAYSAEKQDPTIHLLLHGEAHYELFLPIGSKVVSDSNALDRLSRCVDSHQFVAKVSVHRRFQIVI
jgi:hypothetical protein